MSSGPFDLLFLGAGNLGALDRQLCASGVIAGLSLFLILSSTLSFGSYSSQWVKGRDSMQYARYGCIAPVIFDGNKHWGKRLKLVAFGVLVCRAGFGVTFFGFQRTYLCCFRFIFLRVTLT